MAPLVRSALSSDVAVELQHTDQKLVFYIVRQLVTRKMVRQNSPGFLQASSWSGKELDATI
jgi:hypothetical protein